MQTSRSTSETLSKLSDMLGIVVATVIGLVWLLRFLYPPLWRDLKTLKILMALIRRVRNSCAAREFIIDQFEKQVKLRPQQKLVLFKDQKYSYQEVDLEATKVAKVLMGAGVRQGDTVALLMSNEPAYVWIYLGIQKIGAKAALINNHLVDESLRHCIETCGPKLLIVGDGLNEYLPDHVTSLTPPLSESVTVYSYNTPRSDQKLPSFQEAMLKCDPSPVDPSLRSKVMLSDPCAFIYTSGTTGLPKPAIISHKKAILCSHSYAPVGFSCRDVMYLTLPFYHASALNLALLNVINVGATLVLREKFSASKFWSDCCNYEVTCFQYIGEMLRYLVNTPKSPEEDIHRVWAAIGNGLRTDIWTKVKTRFRLKQIFEFYGSTELPANATNYFNVPGSVGRLSPLLSRLSGAILVRFDPETRLPCRNSEDRCELVKPGDSGILLAKLSDKVTFDGYLGPAGHTSSRILKNVLEEGDFYVNTSDVFTLDSDYNLYFKDRIGDSFRWKGENVCTAEVSNIMNSADFIQDTNVYGVEVPGCEGKAGMAAVNLKDCEKLDQEKVEELALLCRNKLPGYARPRFLRFQRQMSLTSTFKQQKTELCQEGFDPAKVDEPLYFLDRKNDTFKPLDTSAYDDIVKGRIAL